MCFPSGLMLQDSYIIAPLVWCMIKVDNAKMMERGILWLTLQAYLACLAGGGMSIKGLSQLGTAVERAKYDIYAVLAQNGSNLTWGSPRDQSNWKPFP